MHDSDNNSKLDGLEILQGFSHHEHSEDEGKYPSSAALINASIPCTIVLSFKISILVL